MILFVKFSSQNKQTLKNALQEYDAKKNHFFIAKLVNKFTIMRSKNMTQNKLEHCFFQWRINEQSYANALREDDAKNIAISFVSSQN